MADVCEARAGSPRPHARLRRHRPPSGTYNTSYDIWDTDHDGEIMLWGDHNGAVGPLGSYQGDARVGGHSRKVMFLTIPPPGC
ncbi:hypothetical protein [Streptomyces sp. NPDC051001]|uniref:hypothetical protein n=1 Tax=Streptomyces sp. NPDC051001 TaxID=3155795 RepID=UPI00344A5894